MPSWIPVGFVITEPKWELLYFNFFFFFKYRYSLPQQRVFSQFIGLSCSEQYELGLSNIKREQSEILVGLRVKMKNKLCLTFHDPEIQTPYPIPIQMCSLGF